MPGGGGSPVYDRTRDWTVDIRCPHGELVRAPLKAIRRGSERDFIDPCEKAVETTFEDRLRADLDAPPPPPGRFRRWLNVRRFRRALKRGIPWQG